MGKDLKYVEFPVGIDKSCLDNYCYKLDRSTDTLTITSEGNFYNFPKERAPDVVNSLGLKRINVVKKVTLLLAFSPIFIFPFLLYFRQTLGEFYWPLTITLFLGGIMFFLISSDLFDIESYYKISKCKKCNRDFAYEEIKKPLVKKISTYDDYEETETRYFKCKYCNDEDLKIKSLLKSSKSRKRRIPKKGKTCKGCGRRFTLIEYRYPDTHLESFDTRRTIRHYKCKNCGYMEISMKDEAVSTD